MMRWIIGSSMKLRLTVVAFATLMLGLGTQLGDMPVFLQQNCLKFHSGLLGPGLRSRSGRVC